ncbi:hypothetical protein L6R52_07355 [Myxococcota bacterium]|nr:hypothetical protein [Myxococcota bacterium]
MSWLERLVRALPRTLPLPAVAVILGVCSVSEHVWTATTRTRSGQPGTPLATFSLGAMAVCLLAYYLLPKLVVWFPMGLASWRMREPSEAEVSVAVVLLRGLALAVLYFVAWNLYTRA